MMKSVIEFDALTFHALENGHAFVLAKTAPGRFELGTEYQLNSMLRMWDLSRDGVNVGYYFESGFRTVNGGGYLLTFMNSKAGKASESRLAIRSPELIVFDFHKCGTLAISTKISDQMQSILMEQ